MELYYVIPTPSILPIMQCYPAALTQAIAGDGLYKIVVIALSIAILAGREPIAVAGLAVSLPGNVGVVAVIIMHRAVA
jgi:hypothetical protein